MVSVKRVFILTAGVAAAGATLLSGAAALNPGDPLPNLRASEIARFEAGKATFEEIETPADGLGPVFNDVSCGSCHTQGGLGGASERTVTRFGRLGRSGPV